MTEQNLKTCTCNAFVILLLPVFFVFVFLVYRADRVRLLILRVGQRVRTVCFRLVLFFFFLLHSCVGWLSLSFSFGLYSLLFSLKYSTDVRKRTCSAFVQQPDACLTHARHGHDVIAENFEFVENDTRTVVGAVLGTAMKAWLFIEEEKC